MAYTSHGHHIPFTFLEDDKPEKVEECGGVRVCITCTLEGMPYVPAFADMAENTWFRNTLHGWKERCLSKNRNMTVAS